VVEKKNWKKGWHTKVKQLLDGDDSTGDGNADSTGNNKESICGKEEPCQTKATAKDDDDDATDNDISEAIAALFGNDKPTEDKGGEKSNDNDSTDNKAIAALFGKDKPSQAKGKIKKADKNNETMSKVNDLPSLNKDVETPSEGGSRMITIPCCQPVDELSNMEEEKETKLKPHKSTTLFRLKQGVKMKAKKSRCDRLKG
jgi:hypothetical protein